MFKIRFSRITCGFNKKYYLCIVNCTRYITVEEILRGPEVPSFIDSIGEMTDKENIIKIMEELLANTDKFLVDILIQPVNRISVFIDGDRGVSIDDCRKISRSLEKRLNEEIEDFELNVSSPGLDRPLKLLRQYKKNVGRGMEIITINQEKVEGILLSVDDSGVEINSPVKGKKKQEEQKNISLRFRDIKVAKIKIDFRK